MSDDYQGWLTDFELPEPTGEPAYPDHFGWVPPLVPLPRRSPEEWF
ncbi:hypothetical protein [Actinosynnema sp. NPDC020468]